MKLINKNPINNSLKQHKFDFVKPPHEEAYTIRLENK